MSDTVVHRLIVRLSGDPQNLIKTMEKVQQKMQTVGLLMTTFVTAPVAAFGSLAVREFMKFDQAMTESTSIMEATTEQMDRMRETALEAAKGSVKGPEEIARAYFYLASAGLNAEQSISAVGLVTKFATAGAFDLARATDLLTDAQSALGMTSKVTAVNTVNMARVSDVLVKANVLANASVEQFSTALTSKAGSAFKVFNKDIEEGVAVLAAMADQGIKSELAGNNMARIMFLLSNSAQNNQAAFKKYGFSLYDANGKMRNFADIIQNLEQILEPMNDEMKSATLTALGFEARIQGAIMPLIGTSNAIRRYEAELRNAGGTTKDVSDKQMKSLSNQIKITWNQIKVMAIGIGERLAPSVRVLNETIDNMISYWNELSPAMKTVILYMAGFAAAAGPVLLMTAKMIVAWKALTLNTVALGIALKGTVFLAFITGAYLAGKALHELLPWVKRARAAMEEMDSAHAAAMSNMAKRHSETMKQIVAMDTPEEKKVGVNKGLKEAKNEVKKYNREVMEAQRIIDDMNKQWFTTQETIDANEQRLEQALARREEAERNLNNLVEYRTSLEQEANVAIAEQANALAEVEEAIANMVTDLTAERETLGMSSREAAIWQLAHEGATESMLAEVKAIDREITAMEKYNELMEEGKKVVEQYRTPMEKLTQAREDYQRLLDVGAIDVDTFDRANKEALDAYNKELEKTDEKANIKLRMDATSVRAGSAEFERMIADIRPQSSFTSSTTMKSKKEDEMASSLKRLVELEEERRRTQMLDIGIAEIA